MIKCSSNQKKATDGPVDLVFVPYKRTERGSHLRPDGCKTWCGLCHFHSDSGFENTCASYEELKRKCPCEESTRRDQTHGYWKEVK